MNDFKVSPNVNSYCSLIYAYTKKGDLVNAEAWLQKMERAGITADAVVYNTIIKACHNAGDIARCKNYLALALKRRLKLHSSCYTGLINLLAQNGNVKQAESWLGDALSSGAKPDIN